MPLLAATPTGQALICVNFHVRYHMVRKAEVFGVNSELRLVWAGIKKRRPPDE